MKARGMIFTGESVRAILAGRKTKTRRAVTPANSELGISWPSDGLASAFPQSDDSKLMVPGESETLHRLWPKWDAGDRLWVRETWAKPLEQSCNRSDRDIPQLGYRADGEDANYGARWRSPRFMPRWASRLTLELTDVRVERLQAISEEDAIAEGFGADYSSLLPQTADGFEKNYDAMTPLGRFQWTWNLLNAHRGHGWKSNPWVWALTFRRLEAGA